MKKFISILLTLAMVISLVACGATNKETSKKIYYLRTDKMGLYPVEYEIKATTVTSKVKEILDLLSTDVKEVEYMNTIPSGVEIEEWEINSGGLSLHLSESYLSMEPYTEILVRGGIVKSLIQIEGVDSVSFYVDNAPITDSVGNVIGAMTADTFIDNFGEETDSLLNSDITLYYASADGMSLIPETRNVYYSRNVALEKLVVEQLLKGPESEGLLSTMPPETRLISVSLTNGVCYVNFDSNLETAIAGITENVTVYSIVNSLCELSTVKSVQLLVNGEAPHISNIEENLANSLAFKDSIINVTIDEDDSESDEYLDGDILVDEDGNPVSIDVEIMEPEGDE